MKQIITVFFLLFALSTFTSCLEDQCTEVREFYRYNPVLKSLDEIRSDIVVLENRAFENPGRIYYYNNHLFINEIGEGIHVYDNADPENPTYKAFYTILGNENMVIKDGILIADNTMDLISIDISNTSAPVIVNRIEDYKEMYPTQNDLYRIYFKRSKETSVLDCSNQNFNNNRFINDGAFFEAANMGSKGSGNVISNTSGSGQGGSTAMFTIVDNYLYSVDNRNLESYDITDPANPSLKNQANLSWNVETIFPYNNQLFIGTSSGVYIYGLENPASPNYLSQFGHVNACDPVVAQSGFAYVTLRDGSECQGFNNQLEILDISDAANPSLIKIFPMQNPHGLSINGDYLYLCEGAFGLKVFDVANKKNIKLLSHDESITSHDVIYLGSDHLLSIGDSGLNQFDVSNPKSIKLISTIKITE